MKKERMMALFQVGVLEVEIIKGEGKNRSVRWTDGRNRRVGRALCTRTRRVHLPTSMSDTSAYNKSSSNTSCKTKTKHQLPSKNHSKKENPPSSDT